MRVLVLAPLAMVAAAAGGSRLHVESHRDGFETHMQRVAAKGWTRSLGLTSDEKSTRKLELVVAVRQQNTAELEKELMAVSDPHSPRYGRHLSKDEVDALVAPSPESVAAVESWFRAHGVEPEPVTGNKDFIRGRVTIATAEAMLDTTYASFVHESGVSVLRAAAPYSVPATAAGHMDFVTPTVSFPPVHNKPVKGDAGGFMVTPQFLRDMYNLKDTDVGRGAQGNTSQAVASFIKQFYDPNDLQLFWKKYPPLAETPFSDVPVDQSHQAEVEAGIDSEYIAATGAGIKTEMWYTDGTQPGNVENEPFVDWLTTVASMADVPPVFSISYGDEEHGVTESYAVRCGTEFQKAGARGISLLAASGDSGAGCAAGGYVPTFPASSPWVTAVGGLFGGNAGHSPTGETAASLSGGGFSNYFTRPSFQDAAVAAYKKQPGLPQQKMWNAEGAAFPDLSAQALQFDTCSAAFFYPYDGTSCACPTVAGIVSMLNDVRDQAGKRPMGFLNPWLYSTNGTGFNDVTSGNNNYCDQPSAFPSTKGWDAVSGFGSPDYAQLKNAALSLP